MYKYITLLSNKFAAKSLEYQYSMHSNSLFPMHCLAKQLVTSLHITQVTLESAQYLGCPPKRPLQQQKISWRADKRSNANITTPLAGMCDRWFTQHCKRYVTFCQLYPLVGSQDIKKDSPYRENIIRSYYSYLRSLMYRYIQRT